ncbi:MAG: hypothetical protein H7256_01330 [Bdellovibrio sp.]|nr:hypothetical protein [Bdellovibrio sp.]
MSFYNVQETYQKLNEAVSQKLFTKKLNLRIYQSPSLAAFDVTLGLQQFLSHKPMIGICKNGSSLIENLTPQWLRTQTVIQAKHENQSWYEFIESLNPETCFVIWASENEITGEITVQGKQSLEIHQMLSKKRIFSIQICHEENFNLESLQPYSILISRSNLFRSHSSVAVCGDKLKAPSLIGYLQNIKQLDQEINGQFFKKSSDVASKEAQFSDQKIFYYNQFATLPSRINDRLVFYFPDIAGSALQELLQLKPDVSFTASQIPFWILDLWKNWWKEAESEKLIRGLLVISTTAFDSDVDLVHKIEKAVAQIRQNSVWSV